MPQIIQIQLFPTRWLTGIALSLCLVAGVGGNEMWTELFEEQLQRAEDGDVDAQYEVGIMYLKVQGAEKPPREIWWRPVARRPRAGGAKLRRINHQRDKFTAWTNRPAPVTSRRGRDGADVSQRQGG